MILDPDRAITSGLPTTRDSFNSQPFPLALVGNSDLARTTVSRPALRPPHP